MRADIGMAISNENPNFVEGGDGGCGSVSAALFCSAWAADLVSAPIATFLMVGRSHGVRCLLLVWPVLLTVMADLRKINHAMRSMRSHPAWQDGAEAVLACQAHRTRCDANVSFARVNAEKMLQMRALTRGRSRLASKIPHDTLFAPRGVLGRKTST